MSAPRKPAAAPAQARPPVVVTFGEDGKVLDVVGDIDWFVAGDDTRQDIYQRLRDLREGWDGTPDIIPAMQLSQGRYADIHIVAEQDSRHFVLLDATELMHALRRNQQASNEAALLEDRRRRELRKSAPDASPPPRALRQFRRSAELFAELIGSARAPMAQLAGHARLLQQRCKNDPAALRSIAAIQHAAVRLDALSANGLIGLGELTAGARNLGIVDPPQLAGMLQETFALQAQAQGIGFEVRVPENASLIEIDTLALRQILINLVIHALEGIGAGRLVVSLSIAGQGLEIEIASEPSGFDAELFGPLVTTTELLKSDATGNLGLAVSQLLLQQLRATVELVSRRGGGHELWIRLPLDRVADAEDGLRVRESLLPAALLSGEKMAVVAVEPAQRASSVAELLVELGVPVVSVQEVERIEALLRDDALGALVLSNPFEGRNGREILERLELPVESGVMLLTSAEEIPGRSGWLRDRNCVQVAADADHDTLHAALRTVLAG
ncbi:MAG TPA: HAMP domain-containing sensor histidine kinase [Pseudoxanthomonas sp.]|nr:HAMP domain-containing sensor histidine kinase [Pseudoxanthomonas sp.]